MSYICENFLYIMKIQGHVKNISLVKDLAKVIMQNNWWCKKTFDNCDIN